MGTGVHAMTPIARPSAQVRSWIAATQGETHWGVDSLTPANLGPLTDPTTTVKYDTLYDAVVSSGGAGKKPEFWGRYIGPKSGNLFQPEVDFLHRPDHNCRVLLIYRDTYSYRDPSTGNITSVSTYADGAFHAMQAINYITATPHPSFRNLNYPGLTVPGGKRVWIYLDTEIGPVPVLPKEFFQGWSDTMAGSIYGGAGGVYGNTSVAQAAVFSQQYCNAYSQDPLMRKGGAPALLWTNQRLQCQAAGCVAPSGFPGSGTQYWAQNPPGFDQAVIPPCSPPIPPVVIYQYATELTIAHSPTPVPSPYGTYDFTVDLDLANGAGFASMWAPPQGWEAYLIFDDDTASTQYQTFMLDGVTFFLTLRNASFDIKGGVNGAVNTVNYDGVNHQFVVPNSTDPNAKVTVNGNSAKHVIVTYNWLDASGTPQSAQYTTDKGIGDRGAATDEADLLPFMDEDTDGTLYMVTVVQRSVTYPNRDFTADPSQTLIYMFTSNDRGVTWQQRDSILNAVGAGGPGGFGGIVAWGGKLMLYLRGVTIALVGTAPFGPKTITDGGSFDVNVSVPGVQTTDSVRFVTFDHPPSNPNAWSMTGTIVSPGIVRVHVSIIWSLMFESVFPAGTITVQVVPATGGSNIVRVAFDKTAAVGSQWAVPVIVYTGSGPVASLKVARSRDRTVAGLHFIEQPAGLRNRMFLFLDLNGNAAGSSEVVDSAGSDFIRGLRFGEDNQPILLRRSGDPFSPFTDDGSAAHAGYGFVYRKRRTTGGWTLAEEQLSSTPPVTISEQFALLTPGDTIAIGLPAIYGLGERDTSGNYHGLFGPYVLDNGDNYVLSAPQTGGTRYPILPVFGWRRQSGSSWLEDSIDFSKLANKIALSSEVVTYKSHMMPLLVTDSGYIVGAVWMARDGTDSAAHYTIWFVRRKFP